jgi:hypothetical protein
MSVDLHCLEGEVVTFLGIFSSCFLCLFEVLKWPDPKEQSPILFFWYILNLFEVSGPMSL